MLTLNKLIGCVTLVAGGATGVAVLCSMKSSPKVVDNTITKVFDGVTVKYVSEANGKIGVKSFTMGSPAPEVRRNK